MGGDLNIMKIDGKRDKSKNKNNQKNYGEPLDVRKLVQTYSIYNKHLPTQGAYANKKEDEKHE